MTFWRGCPLKTETPDIEHYADKLSAINEISAHFDGIRDAMKRLPVPGRKVVANYMRMHLAHIVAEPDVIRADLLQLELDGGAPDFVMVGALDDGQRKGASVETVRTELVGGAS